MKLLKNGKNILNPEITNISKHGFWVFINSKEFFLSYEKYPWFKDATISDISNVKIFHHSHLYWPNLDVDLSLDILADPDKYPLVHKK